MKRLLFILAFMLIGNFAFASDDVKDDTKKILTFDVEKALTNSLELMQCTFIMVKDSLLYKGTCTVTITFYDEEGRVTSTHTFIHRDVDSATDCSRIADRYADAIR